MPIQRRIILERLRKVAKFAQTRRKGGPAVLTESIEDLADEMEAVEDQPSGSRNGDTEPSRLTTPLV